MRRRDFIKSSAALGLSFGAAPAIRAQEKAKTYRTAIIGAGWWGMNILHEAMASGKSSGSAMWTSSS
jgi:hypothetical protein